MYNHKYVQQIDESDCGPAVLSMLLKYYDSQVSLSKVRKYAQTDKNGTTALGLIKAGEHFGLSSIAISADTSLFNETRTLSSLPFIAHLDKDNGMLHYVLVTEIHKNYLIIADPDPNVQYSKLSFDQFEHLWTGVVLFMKPGKNYKPVYDDSDNFWDTLKILRNHKSIVIKTVFATLFSTAIAIYGTIFIKNLIDVYVPDKKLGMLNIIVMCLMIAYILHGFFIYIQNYFSLILGQNLSREILLKYIKHLFSLPINFFENRKIGEITTRFTDASTIIETISEISVSTIINIGTILIVYITLSIVSFKLFLISLIIFPMYGIAIIPFLKKFDMLNNRRMESGSDLGSNIIENLRGIESVKSLGIEELMYERINNKFENWLKSNYKYGITYARQKSIKDIMHLLIELFILYFGARMAIDGKISIGQLIAFNTLLGYIMDPMESVINLQNNLQTAIVANKRLNQIISIPSEDNKKGINLDLRTNKSKKIEFKNVIFEYKYGHEILNKINLSIHTNEKVAIVGLSGSGKTSLVKLLVDFYEPKKGNILINGKNINKINKEQIRNNISYLPQTPYIFSGTVIENIALGAKNKYQFQDIVNAAKIAKINNDIQKLPDGYHTMLGENSGLSGGQMQRIAIARTILLNSPIMIFDESTSNLDLLTEKEIIENLMNLKDNTIIFIAHRLEIAKKADRIIVIDNGKIVEDGDHEELISKKGKYYKLWEC